MALKLQDILPTPNNANDEWVSKDPWFKKHEGETSKSTSLVSVVKEPPPYGARKGWAPRAEDEFGDGGAFPEIIQAQFPLGMGKSSTRVGSAHTLALQVDSEGKVQYDAIARVGHGKNKIVYTKLADMKGQFLDEQDDRIQKPDMDAIVETTEKTRQALEKLTQTKVASALPVQHAVRPGPAEYIRYTPATQGDQYAAGAQQRIIRMVEEQRDPMEPPRFQINTKLPRPPPSPPAPVMHSPPRKLTTKDQADWKIPPCMSNWKNPKGYTIALDKRLAADGRGLQQVHINENFAKLSEALYIADRKAREAVEMRSQLEKRMAQKKKEEQEEMMREIARKAREQRQGIRHKEPTEEADDDVTKRDEIRRDRMLDRRKDRNIAAASKDKGAKLRNEKDRDISEKIALGIADPRAGAGRGGGEGTQFDERLFNQSQGIDAGGGFDDETYAAYDQPWRKQDLVTKNIYRPSKNLDNDIYGSDFDKVINTNRFVPDKGFAGADPAASGKRDGPVQFEKNDDDDPFGVGQLLDAAEKGKRKGDDSAAAASSSGSKDSKRSRR